MKISEKEEKFIKATRYQAKLFGTACEVPEMQQVIVSSHLRNNIRYNLFSKTKLVKKWHDTNKCHIVIDCGKPKIRILRTLDKEMPHVYSYDPYFGLSIKDCYLFCKFLIVNQSDEDTYMCGMIGEDNMLRTYVYDKFWERISNLMWGEDLLVQIFANLDTFEYVKLIGHNLCVPADNEETYLIYQPHVKNIKNIIKGPITEIL